MQPFLRIFTLSLIGICLFVGANAQSSKPAHRFAARLNILGAANLDAIGEIEYLFTNRLGVFAGGGMASSIVDLRQGFWPSLKWSPWLGGAYLGMRIGIPVGKLQGLSLKPTFAYQAYKRWDLYPIPDHIIFVQQGTLVFVRRSMDAYVSLAYAQTFGKRFFGELVIGTGPSWLQFTEGKLQYSGFAVPTQVNLGVRF